MHLGVFNLVWLLARQNPPARPRVPPAAAPRRGAPRAPGAAAPAPARAGQCSGCAPSPGRSAPPAHMHMHPTAALAVQHRRLGVAPRVQPGLGRLLELVQRPCDLPVRPGVLQSLGEHPRRVPVLERRRVGRRGDLLRVPAQDLDPLPPPARLSRSPSRYAAAPALPVPHARNFECMGGSGVAACQQLPQLALQGRQVREHLDRLGRALVGVRPARSGSGCSRSAPPAASAPAQPPSRSACAAAPPAPAPKASAPPPPTPPAPPPLAARSATPSPPAEAGPGPRPCAHRPGLLGGRSFPQAEAVGGT